MPRYKNSKYCKMDLQKDTQGMNVRAVNIATQLRGSQM
jgi:hypothetical protein